MAIIQDNMAAPDNSAPEQVANPASINTQSAQPQNGQGAPSKQDADVISQAINQIAQSGHMNPHDSEGFQRLAHGGMQVIYNNTTHDTVMGMLKQGADNPSATLAQTTVFIMSTLAKTANQQIPPAILLPASAVVLLMLAQLAGETSALKIDSDTLGQALHQGLQTMQQTFNIPDDVVAPIATLLSPDKFNQMSQQYTQSPEGQQALSSVKDQVNQKYAPMLQQAQQQKAQQGQSMQQPNQSAGV